MIVSYPTIIQLKDISSSPSLLCPIEVLVNSTVKGPQPTVSERLALAIGIG